MNKLSFGQIDASLEEFGILEAPILFNGHTSGYKAIIKNGSLVAILGQDYKTLPNKIAVQIAENVAETVGAKPLKSKVFGGGHIAFNATGTKFYATYTLPKAEEVGGEKVYVGFTVRNAIDGTLAFSCSGFTFRGMCKNGVILGYKKLAYFYRKHTKGFSIDRQQIERRVLQVISDTYQVIDNYRKLQQLKLNETIAQQIAQARFISRKFIPDYIEVGRKGQLIVFDPNVSLWEVYNDLTARIWHNEQTTLDSKIAQFNALHQIIRV